MSTAPSGLSSRSFAGLVAQRAVLVALLVAAWWLASVRMPQFVLPGPAKVGAAFIALVHSETFFDDLGITLYRVLAGFVLAAIVGAPLGIVLGSSPRAARAASTSSGPTPSRPAPGSSRGPCRRGSP